jgi:predicted DNA-binding protein
MRLDDGLRARLTQLSTDNPEISDSGFARMALERGLPSVEDEYLQVKTTPQKEQKKAA